MIDTAREYEIIIIGAGPAGLAAGLKLAENGRKCLIVEMADSVGGISKTIEKDGFRFDLGGHRFFTNNSTVNNLWKKTLGDKFIKRRRKSRIFYNNSFFNYPISISDTIKKLGLFETFKIGASYLQARITPRKNTKDLESWLCNLFGKQLFKHFFKSYTEKVWGVPCKNISSDWGAQRIKGLNLVSVIKNALNIGSGKIKTLIDEFDYPLLGPGQMYEKMGDNFKKKGGTILTTATVKTILYKDKNAHTVIIKTNNGDIEINCQHIISSMPFTELITSLSPPLPSPCLALNNNLNYRSFITVNLFINSKKTIPDTWLYIHDPKYSIGRVQCFKNWSPKMVPDDNKSSLGCEFFVTEGDELWNMPEEEIVKIAKNEICQLGIIDKSLIYDGFAVKVAKAYPVFDLNYVENISKIRLYLDKITNIQPIGRYGMFKYNNMDHSILTGIMAAENILGENHDIWKISLD